MLPYQKAQAQAKLHKGGQWWQVICYRITKHNHKHNSTREGSGGRCVYVLFYQAHHKHNSQDWEGSGAGKFLIAVYL
jgi:hypothetical protein